MYRSLDNILANPHVGLLFIDFERAKRIRVNGVVQLSEDDPLITEFPSAVFMVRVTAQRIFPNCPRYVHEMKLLKPSQYSPRPDYTPPAPAWKSFESFRDALPARDRPDW